MSMRIGIAIADDGQRAALGGFGRDVADGRAPRRARKAPVGQQGDLVIQPHARQQRGGRQHLAHARTALGPLVADDQHVALLELRQP